MWLTHKAWRKEPKTNTIASFFSLWEPTNAFELPNNSFHSYEINSPNTKELNITANSFSSYSFFLLHFYELLQSERKGSTTGDTHRNVRSTLSRKNNRRGQLRLLKIIETCGMNSEGFQWREKEESKWRTEARWWWRKEASKIIISHCMDVARSKKKIGHFFKSWRNRMHINYSLRRF